MAGLSLSRRRVDPSITDTLIDPQILEGMPITDEVEELLKVMGPFYELVDEKKRITQISDLSSGTALPPRLLPQRGFLLCLLSVHRRYCVCVLSFNPPLPSHAQPV